MAHFGGKKGAIGVKMRDLGAGLRYFVRETGAGLRYFVRETDAD